MNATRKRLFDQAVRNKRLKFENGKWWALCATCTGRLGKNKYYVVRKRKILTIEECCMDVLQDWSVYTCKHNTRERLI